MVVEDRTCRHCGHSDVVLHGKERRCGNASAAEHRRIDSPKKELAAEDDAASSTFVFGVIGLGHINAHNQRLK